VINTAKKRFFKRRTASRGFFRRSRSKSSSGLMMPLAGAGIYGFGRGYLSNWVTPTANRFLGMFGQYADEAGMFLANYLAYRFIGNKVPLVKDAAKAGMLIEVAMATSQMTGAVSNSTASTGDWE